MADLHRAGLNLRKPPVFHRVGISGSGGPDWLRNDYEFIVCTSAGRLPWSDNCAMGKPPKFVPGGAMSHRLSDGSRKNKGWATRGSRKGDTMKLCEYVPPKIANPGNVIRCKVGGGNMGDRLCHENEAPFPEALAEFFIRSFCPPGGLVCDCFSGSGTTAAMAVKLGRNFSGCDVRQSQVDLSLRRLGKVTSAAS